MFPSRYPERWELFKPPGPGQISPHMGNYTIIAVIVPLAYKYHTNTLRHRSLPRHVTQPVNTPSLLPFDVPEVTDTASYRLRQSAMCHGDMTLYGYSWVPETSVPRPVAHPPRVCSNWAHLQSWAVEREVDVNSDILQHPTLGECRPLKTQLIGAN